MWIRPWLMSSTAWRLTFSKRCIGTIRESLHGTEDAVVPVAQSRALAQRVPHVEYHEYEGEGHGWSRPSTTEDELERIGAFLARVLG